LLREAQISRRPSLRQRFHDQPSRKKGTVTFSTTDPDSGVVLPGDYTFISRFWSAADTAGPLM
jgi:hypothetical protein